jgi:hypothetical protein
MGDGKGGKAENTKVQISGVIYRIVTVFAFHPAEALNSQYATILA